MINDEFEELLASIETGYENNKRSNADDIIMRTYHFFNKLKEELKVATGDEKDELLQMIKTMQERVNEYSQKSCDRVGMSESELMRLSDDENIFTADQKKVLEMARKEMQASSKEIRKHMEAKNIVHKAVDLEADPVKENKKSSAKKRNKKRDKWTKA
ncbi:MAG: hypothetical protein P0S95_02095 [Rhabdochlamydiaceae bacterium]|nr:hypothetical protein [Candidatus Amphrikana amoebophyrae]